MATKRDVHDKVLLWEDGPYWATTNIGAERPEDFGYYFWWGDTVGYKREKDKWVATDGSSSDFSFEKSSTTSIPTGYLPEEEYEAFLKGGGWITDDGVLAPEHDAAHVQWGGGWRMPTRQESQNLMEKCDWTWKEINGVNGYVVRGKGAYASTSIFLPASGIGNGTSLYVAGSYGYYWTSIPGWDDDDAAWGFNFCLGYHDIGYCCREEGYSVRPVHGVTK